MRTLLRKRISLQSLSGLVDMCTHMCICIIRDCWVRWTIAGTRTPPLFFIHSIVCTSSSHTVSPTKKIQSIAMRFYLQSCNLIVAMIPAVLYAKTRYFRIEYTNTIKYSRSFDLHSCFLIYHVGWLKEFNSVDQFFNGNRFIIIFSSDIELRQGRRRRLGPSIMRKHTATFTNLWKIVIIKLDILLSLADKKL